MGFVLRQLSARFGKSQYFSYCHFDKYLMRFLGLLFPAGGKQVIFLGVLCHMSFQTMSIVRETSRHDAAIRKI
jgi:hypothetical protein